jgi:hypothetical protein
MGLKSLGILVALLAPLPAMSQSVDPAFLNRLLDRHKPNRAAFEFALIGDQEYGAEGIAKWPALSASLNRDNRLKFVIHDGDIKNGSTVCSDEMYRARLGSFNNIEHPLIYTPGDNEWTDCHRANNGSYDPLERLELLRRTFFSDSDSLGKKKIRLSRQSEEPRSAKFVENAIWSEGAVVFATVHVVGSNNNLGRNAANDVEYRERNAANLVWINTAFSLARDGGFDAIMLIIQANPNFELAPTNAERTGFNDTLYALEINTLVFGKPVVLVHGDSHYYRLDKPLLGTKSRRMIENFTRVETFGSADVHWTKAKVDPNNASVFTFEEVMVKENLVRHELP